MPGMENENNHVLEHKHLIVTATVKKTFDSCDHLKNWFRRIITGIGMQVADLGHGQQNPNAFYCNDIGNTGYTGVAILVTSHASLHQWDAVYPHKFEFDLYSCSNFKPEDIIPFIDELEIVEIDYKFIDRANGVLVVEDSGHKKAKQLEE